MHCHWTYNFGLFVQFLVAEVLSTQQTSNYYYLKILDDNPVTIKNTSRLKRQINNYDDNTTTTPVEIVMTSTCTFDQQEENDQCTINVKTLGYDHPLILNSSESNSISNLIYPDNDGNVKLPQNSTIFLSCPGSNNRLKSLPDARSSGKFMCLCGSAFSTEDTIYDFEELSCKLRAKYEIVDKGFYGRESEYRKFEIGFYVSSVKQQKQKQQQQQQFLTLLEVHYDRSTMSTMYVKSKVSRHISGRQKPAKLLGYDQTHCCERQRNRLDMDLIYQAQTQDRSFAAQLYCHDSEFQTRCSYLDVSSAIIFNPAQLSPRNSFVYAAAGSTTFVYLNTAPQWRPINEGNWARIEDHVVEMAKEFGRDLVVYTGIYQRLQLKDTGDADKLKYMFLHATENSEKAIPIPRYFWKIVYEPQSKRGVVYVTLNNIYVDNVDDYKLCEKPMFDKDGVRMPKQWKPKNVAKGYSYMCEVPDFMRSTADAITFHGFSPAVVTDLLYLVKK